MTEDARSAVVDRPRGLPPLSERRQRVSIVMPTYKRSEFLERAIASVVSQTYQDWELLVVDDNDPGSKHRSQTERCLQRLDADPRIVYLKHNSNRGGGAARNTGIMHASGELVAFLDDDDEWEPRKLEWQVARLAAAPPGVAMVYCGYRKVYVGSGRESVVLPDERKHTLASLLRENGIGTTSTILCRRRPLLEVGMFDVDLPSRQDVDLYVRLARTFRFEFVPQALVTWYRHEGEAIGKNRERSITAHRRFLRKHRDDLARHPGAYSHRLLRLGILLLNQRRLTAARHSFRRAWRIAPTNVAALLWALFANRFGFSLYRGVMNAKARCRPGPWRRWKTV